MTTTSAATTKRSPQQTREALIRLAAYSFYERRGFIEGHEIEDWLQAEMEIDRRAAAVPSTDESSAALN